MKPKPHHAPVNHRDAVMKFITTLRQALPHEHVEFVLFLKGMWDKAQLPAPRPSNFTTHVRVIQWFVAKRALDHKHAERYHTLLMSYITSIAVYDTDPREPVDFLLYAGYLLLT